MAGVVSRGNRPFSILRNTGKVWPRELMAGPVADLRWLWVACMQGAEEDETKPFYLISVLQTT